jgi:hypothetical protein
VSWRRRARRSPKPRRYSTESTLANASLSSPDLLEPTYLVQLIDAIASRLGDTELQRDAARVATRLEAIRASR